MSEFAGFGCGSDCGGRKGVYGVELVSVGGYRGSAFITVEAVGTVAIISLRTLATGRYRYRLWLSDSATDPKESLPPANVDALHWDGITDENGQAEIRLEYTAPRRTYYPWVEIVPVAVGSGIEIGTI